MLSDNLYLNQILNIEIIMFEVRTNIIQHHSSKQRKYFQYCIAIDAFYSISTLSIPSCFLHKQHEYGVDYLSCETLIIYPLVMPYLSMCLQHVPIVILQQSYIRSQSYIQSVVVRDLESLKSSYSCMHDSALTAVDGFWSFHFSYSYIHFFC